MKAFDYIFVEFLRGSKFHGDIPEMGRYFDRTTKCAFRDKADPHYVRFGSARDRDPKLKITAGKLRLEGFVLVLSSYASTYFCIGIKLPPSLSPPSSASLTVFWLNVDLPTNRFL